MKTRQDAINFISTIAGNHLPRTARSYKHQSYIGEVNHSGLGFQVDLQPFTGKVVELNEDWVVLKERGAVFMIVDRNLMKEIPELNSTITLTTYARRHFNGTRLDAPKVEVSESGYTSNLYMLGKSNSDIPFGDYNLQSPFLKDMVDQIYQLKCPDGIRNLSNSLVDMGGENPSLMHFCDPEDKMIIETPPSLTFAVNTKKLKGSVMISYDRAMDYYDVVFRNELGLIVGEVNNVCVINLAECVCTFVDDGEWKFATFEVVKKAPKVKS